MHTFLSDIVKRKITKQKKKNKKLFTNNRLLKLIVSVCLDYLSLNYDKVYNKESKLLPAKYNKKNRLANVKGTYIHETCLLLIFIFMVIGYQT